MDKQVTLRIIIEQPVSGVEYGVQKGQGSKYETIQRQSSENLNDLTFEIPVSVKFSDNAEATFFGPFVQGPRAQRFVYIDIGTYAGQKETPWARRLKIPLTGISEIFKNSAAQLLVTKVPGKGKDGGPNCATVKPFLGWKLST
jgi:hypothetical protein